MSKHFIYNFDIKKEELPVMILISKQDNLVDNLAKFVWKSPNNKIEAKDIEEFISNCTNNKGNRFFHSEDVADKNPSKLGIYTLVRKNFNDFFAKNINNDTLILFCSHLNRKCNRLERTYERLAKKLKNNKNLVVAEVDPTHNELDKVNIQEFPYLLMIKAAPSNEQSITPENRIDNSMKYRGNYTLSDLISFVEQNVFHKANVTKFDSKKEEKILKYEKKNPVIIQGEEEHNIHYYAFYGRQRYMLDPEREEYDDRNEHDDYDRDHEESDDYEMREATYEKKNKRKEQGKYKKDL